MPTFTFSDIKTGEEVFTFLGDKDDCLAWIDSQVKTFIWLGSNLVIKQGQENYRMIAGLRGSWNA